MKHILFWVLSLITLKTYAQLPDCAGADSNVVFLHGSNTIYRYDPALPISGTNPSVFLTSGSMPWGGLTVSYNLNGGAASPTFYATDGGLYYYWDGVNWVNTGHSAATVNLGGGVNTIYGKNGSSGYISKYVGTGNDVFFVNGHANSGPYDLVTDNQDNLYEIDISTAIGKIYKYNTSGVIIDTIIVLGVTPQGAGPGFAIVGNTVVLGVNTTPGVYVGQIINDTANCVAAGNFTVSYGDFANCPSNTNIVTASFVYSTCLGPVGVPISSPLLNGTPTFAWNFGDPNSGINNTSTLGHPTHTFSSGGTYTVTLVITNGAATDTIINTVVINSVLYDTTVISICEPNTYQGHSVSGVYVDSAISQYGCDSVHTLFLTVNPLKTITIDTTICFGQSFLGYNASGTYIDHFLSAAGCDSARTIHLTVRPKIETFLTANICSNENYYGYTQTGNYTDVFTSVTGCDSTRYINLTVNPNPEVTISFEEKEICKGDQVTLTGNGADIYKWYLNSESTPSSTAATFDVNVNDHEFILLEGYSQYGCRDAETVTLNYIPCCGHVFVPNVFSPNGDKLNDVFRIKFDQDLETYQLKIFDRWGTELFSSNDVQEGWNGMYKGKECNQDTYYYLIYIKCKENKILKGDFILVR